MQQLLELQTAVARAIVGGGPSIVLHTLHDDAPGAAARLAIYQNHYRVTLIDVLASTFNVARQAVGPDVFGAAARDYVLSTPPQDPCLHHYGAGFPRFLARLPAGSCPVYAADLARLEWAIQMAALAEEPTVDRDAAILQPDVDTGVCLVVHPSCRMVCARYPVDHIWQAFRSNQGLDAAVVDGGDVRLLVHRRGDDVGWSCLSMPAAVFTGVLVCGGTLRKAYALSRALDVRFDPTGLLALLLEDGVVRAVSGRRH